MIVESEKTPIRTIGRVALKATRADHLAMIRSGGAVGVKHMNDEIVSGVVQGPGAFVKRMVHVV